MLGALQAGEGAVCVCRRPFMVPLDHWVERSTPTAMHDGITSEQLLCYQEGTGELARLRATKRLQIEQLTLVRQVKAPAAVCTSRLRPGHCNSGQPRLLQLPVLATF